MDSDSRRIQNSKESGIRTVEKSLSARNMLEGEQLISKPKGKPLALYKKHKGTLWKTNFSKNGNQTIDNDLVIDNNLEVKGKIVSNDIRASVNATSGLVLSTTGNVTKPANCCFYLYASATQADIADGEDVTIVFGGEQFDLNGNCTSNTFTAPVAGKYFLHANIGINSIDISASYYILKIKTSNRSYEKWIDDKTFSADTGYHTFSLTAIADMDASDTAYVTLFQEGSNTHQTDILYDSDNSPARTYFTGYLIG